MKKILLIILLTKSIFATADLLSLMQSIHRRQAMEQQQQKANRNQLQKAVDKDNLYSLLAQNYKTYQENRDTTMSADDQLDYEDEQKEFNKNLAIQHILDQGGTYTTAGGVKYEKVGDKVVMTKTKDILDNIDDNIEDFDMDALFDIYHSPETENIMIQKAQVELKIKKEIENIQQRLSDPNLTQFERDRLNGELDTLTTIQVNVFDKAAIKELEILAKVDKQIELDFNIEDIKQLANKIANLKASLLATRNKRDIKYWLANLGHYIPQILVGLLVLIVLIILGKIMLMPKKEQ